MVKALLLDKKNQSLALTPSSTPALVKAVEPNCITCGGAHSYQNCPATNENAYRDNIQEYVSQAAAASYNQGNTGFQPQGQSTLNQCQNIQNQNQNLQIQMAALTEMMSKLVSSNTASSSGSGTLPGNTIANPKEELKGITTRSGVAYQGPKTPSPSKQGTKVTKDKPVVTPVGAPIPNLKPSIPYPSRHDNEKRRNQANEKIEKFYEIFKDMSFEISFTDALTLMPKFASTLKALIRNKEKLNEMARTPMNEHCSAVILNKLPRKLGDPGKFLIPCEFPGMDECLALENLGASINRMSFSVWEALSLSELTPTCMTLKLADRSVSKPIDFEPDPRVPLILGRCFLKTGRALIDMYKEVLGFSDVTASGNPTPDDDPIVSTTSPTLTPFRDSDFLLFEEANAFLGPEDDPDSPKINPFYYDPEGDILLLETILNSEPLRPLPNHEQYFPSYKKELKVCEAKAVKSSIDEPPEVELKDLPPYLEYAFLEGGNKLPVIIAKELGDKEKSALTKVLKSHKTTNQRCNIKDELIPKIHDVIKKEVEKLLDAGLIYPTFDSPWVSPIHCVPKKDGFTVVANEENDLIPNRLVTGWRVCIDYRKLNEATRKDHFPLPFMDQMLERLAGNEY
nr:reverse transcriptase domain-containing protein [Tanacetum cinerariifolium]